MTADEFAAIEQARALMLRPAQVAVLRRRDFPRGMRTLLRVAAGDAAALELAADRTGDTPAALREASVFYVQQVMLDDASDSYRILGVDADAPASEIKAHYGLLMRWMHPDRNPDGWDAVFVERVNRAWNDLRTTDRRDAFDAARLAPDEAEHEDWTEQAAPFRRQPAHEAVAHRPIAEARAEFARAPVGKAISSRQAIGASLAAIVALVLFVVWPTFDGDGDSTNHSTPENASSTGFGRDLPQAASVAPVNPASSRIAAPVTAKPQPNAPLVASSRAPAADITSRPSTGASDLPVAAAPRSALAVLEARAKPVAKLAPATISQTPGTDGEARIAASSRIEVASSPGSSEPMRAARPRQVRGVETAANPDQVASTAALPAASAPPSVPEAQPVVPDLDQASLLIGRFARAYQRGDIDAMSALFAHDAQSQGGGMAQIREAYDRLFEQTTHRSISIRDIQWRIEDERARAIGHFEISQARDKESKAKVSRGTIRFDIEQRQDQLLIARLEHTDRGQ